MSIWSKLFGWGEKEGVNKQLPSTMVAKEFGEVNVKRRGDQNEKPESLGHA